MGTDMLPDLREEIDAAIREGFRRIQQASQTPMRTSGTNMHDWPHRRPLIEPYALKAILERYGSISEESYSLQCLADMQASLDEETGRPGLYLAAFALHPTYKLPMVMLVNAP